MEFRMWCFSQKGTDAPTVASAQWDFWPSILAPYVSTSNLDRHVIIQLKLGMVWFLGVGYSGQPVTCDCYLWLTLQSGNQVLTFLVARDVRWIIFALAKALCTANLHKWGLASSDKCECGMAQTMSHLVNECPLTKLSDGDMQRLPSCRRWCNKLVGMNGDESTCKMKWNCCYLCKSYRRQLNSWILMLV